MSAEKFNLEEANKASVKRLYLELFNQQKLAIADQLIAPTLVVPGPTGGTGPEGFKANAWHLLTGFPDVQFTLHDLLADGDCVVARWTWQGTHRGTFATIPATGKQVRQEGMVMYRLHDGKVTGANVYFDRLAVFQQLGVSPASAAPPPSAPIPPVKH